MGLGIKSIDHIQIAVPRDREVESVAFYRDLLGLHEIPKPEELRGRGGAWFQLSNMQFHIGIDPEPSPRSKRHVCFLVSHLANARAKLVGKGVDIEEESVAEGLRRIFVRDPAGNRVEIGER